jgi:hypothetical protein
MMRVAALFAVLAVASAKKIKKFQFPNPTQYTVEGQKLVQPGGHFEVLGVVDQGTPDTARMYSYCPVGAEFLGVGKFDIQRDTREVAWSVGLLVLDGNDDASIQRFSGTSSFELNRDDQTNSPIPQFLTNKVFTMSANGFDFHVEIDDAQTAVFTTLLNRENGLSNCAKSYGFSNNAGTQENPNMIRINNACTDDFCHAGISDFTISQTSQGGFFVSASIYTTQPLKGNALSSAVLNTHPYGNIGIACALEGADEGGILNDGVVEDDVKIPSVKPMRPKRKHYLSPQRNERCPSFAAWAYEFGYQAKDAFYAFSGKVPKYNVDGKRVHAYYQMMITQHESDADLWYASLRMKDGEYWRIDDQNEVGTELTFLVKRTDLVDSSLAVQSLKHKETRNNKKFKQAQRSAAKLPEDFASNPKDDKPRSFKKRTKTKETNSKKRRRNWRTREKRDQAGN